MQGYNYEIFIRNLKSITNGATNIAIAAAADTTSSTVSKWKKGSSTPTVEQLIGIANKYHCSVDYLLGIDTKENTDTLSVRDACKLMIRLKNRFDGIIETHSDNDAFGDTDTVTLSFSSRFQNCYPTIDGDELPIHNPTHSNFESFQIGQFFDKYSNLEKMEFDKETRELFINALLDKTDQNVSEWEWKEVPPL